MPRTSLPKNITNIPWIWQRAFVLDHAKNISRKTRAAFSTIKQALLLSMANERQYYKEILLISIVSCVCYNLSRSSHFPQDKIYIPVI